MEDYGLQIDADQTSQRIIAYLQEIVGREDSSGLLLGPESVTDYRSDYANQGDPNSFRH
jgi:hypothetical protein